MRRLRRLPRVAGVLLALAALAAGTVVYQVARKPTELLAVVVPRAPKAPESTWEDYRPLFEAHATALIRPELLAALAQAESGGDPLASPPWRFRWSVNPLDLYGPASSAVGLLQMTDGNLEDARRLCVHGHEVAREGPWHDPRACWLNGLYARVLPGDAVEMTSAWLDASLREISAQRRNPAALAGAGAPARGGGPPLRAGASGRARPAWVLDPPGRAVRRARRGELRGAGGGARAQVRAGVRATHIDASEPP